MKKKQILAWMLSAVMAVSVVPGNASFAWASEPEAALEEVLSEADAQSDLIAPEDASAAMDVSFEETALLQDAAVTDDPSAEDDPVAEELLLEEGVQGDPVETAEEAGQDAAFDGILTDETAEESAVAAEEYETAGAEAETSGTEEAAPLTIEGEMPQETELLEDGFALSEEETEEAQTEPAPEAVYAEADPEEFEEETDAGLQLAAEAATYTVQYDLNGGTWVSGCERPNGDTVDPDYDGSVYLPDSYEVERTGYLFLGWTEEKNGSKRFDGEYIPQKSITLYASWEKMPLVAYDLNGGSWDDSFYASEYGTAKTVESGEEVYLPGADALKREGYQFQGWTTVKNSADVVNEYYYTVKKDVTFYAKWEKLMAVKYDPNGAKWADDYAKDSYGKVQYLVKGKETHLPGSYTMERTGYKLAGWTIAKDSGTVYETYSNYKVTKDVTFYAKWEKQYAVKYDVNGGKWKNDYYKETGYVDKNEEVWLPGRSYLERSGYVLKGWTLKKNTGTVYEDQYKITADVTFYAKWVPAVTIKFDVNGGKWKSDYYKNGEVIEKGTSTYLPGNSHVERKGYILKGWTLQKNKGSLIRSDAYQFTKSVTLYAKWAKAYTITFNAGKGYYGSAKTKTMKVEVESGRAIGDHLTNASYYPKNGKQSFAGWYKDAKLKTPAKKSDLIKKNTTYYAKWYTKSYKITVTNLKGASYYDRGTDQYVEASASKASSYSYYIAQGDSIGYLYAYKNGVNALLYFDKACKEKPYYSSYIPTGNTTVYAKFFKEVTVTWDANGGQERYGDRATGTIRTRKNLMCEDLPEVTRKGYYFAGWVDTAKPKKILRASHVFTKNTTVKAKWAKAIKITLKANGGSFSSYGKVASYSFEMQAKTRIGSTNSYWNTPSRKGYTLAGWKNAATKKTVKDLYDEKPAKSTTYTAVWKKTVKSATVKVTLVGGAGSLWAYDEKMEDGTYVTKKVVEVPKNATYAESYLSSSSHDEPSKKLSFGGWSLSKNGKVLSAGYKFTKAVTLYPVWNRQKAPVYVVLVTNGGAINNRPDNNAYVYYGGGSNTALTLPDAKSIEREGYTFAGWYTDFKCTKKVADPKKFKTSKTCYVYAKWKK